MQIWHRSTATRSIVSGLVVLAVLVPPAAVFALEEVIVTAQRRETRLQETPISISALSGEALLEATATDVTDIGRLAPNMFLLGGANSSGSANNAQIYMRGVGQTDFLPTADPGVGLYIDDVYLGRSVGGILTLTDIERVEVLRGPQGTQFGRNTIGGVVHIITRKPELDTFDASVRLTGGNDDWRQTDGFINIPLGERVAGRATWRTLNRDGYGSSSNAGFEFGNDENYSARGQLKFDVNDDLDLLFAADYYHQNQSSTPSIAFDEDFTNPQTIPGLYNNLFVPLSAAFNPPPPPPFTPADLRPRSEPFDLGKTGPSQDDADIWGVSLVANWRLGEQSSLKSITAYRDLEAHYADDNDGVLARFAETDERFEQNQFSQELQLFGSAGKLDWLVGFYYFHEHAISENDVPLVPGLYTLLSGLPGPIIPLAPGVMCPPPPGVPLPCAGGFGNPFNLDVSQHPLNDITVDSYALFFEGTYDFTEHWALTFGGRYSYEKKDFFTLNFSPEQAAVLGSPTLAFDVPPTRREASFNDFSPRVTLEYRWHDDLLTYATYSQGFRSGTFNGRAGAQRAVESVEPEDIETLEIGFKSEWFGNRLRVNGAGYYSIYENLQFISVEPDPAAGFIVFLRNAQEAEISGFELEGQASISDAFSVYANVGLADSEVTEIDPLLSLTTGVQEGAQLRKSPEWTYAIGGRYVHRTGIGDFVANVDWNWRSEIEHEASNNPNAREDSYGLLNVRLAWQSPDGHWEIAGFGKNVTDETYFNSLFIAGGTLAVAYPHRGVEYGAQLVWRY